jgi:gamma-glutamylcyclotransferase (GGCT)/AIG2-like uncharacterized protein YtfP
MKTKEIIQVAERPLINYFAYGMLTDPDLMQGITRIGVATLPNYSFELLQYANIYVDAGGKTSGVLWAIDSAIQEQLDSIEGYPTFYDRKTVLVHSNGRRFNASVYMMTPDSRELLRDTTPRRDYIQRVSRGYISAGMALDQIQRAMA